MSRIAIRRRHALAHTEAHRRVSRAAVALARRFGAAWSWDGDVLRIEHPGVRGTVFVGVEEIQVDAELGLGLRLFRGRAEREIAQILDRELGA